MATAADLVGGYTIMSGEKYGQPEPPERVAGSTVRFTEDTVSVVDKTDQERYVASYQVETGSSPWKIVMTATNAPNAGEVARGLVEKTGDTVRLIYALPGGDDPTEFKTKAKQLMFVMQNLRK